MEAQPRPKFLTYQESIVGWLPGVRHARQSAYLWWALICLLIVPFLLLVNLNPSLSAIASQSVRLRLRLALILSCLATFWEVVAVIWGCNKCEHLARKLPEIFKFPAEQLEDWLNKRLKLVWRSWGVLLIGIIVGTIGWVTTYFAGRETSSHLSLRLFFSFWFGFGAFWCGAAMYHIGAISHAIYELSRKELNIAFPHPMSSGIREVGRLALTYFFEYAFAAMLWIFVFLALPTTGFIDFWGIGILATIIGLILFLIPQFSIHSAMLQNKRKNINDLLKVIGCTYNSWVEKDSQSSVPKEVKDLLELYGFVAKLPTWPFDLTVIPKLIPPSILPLLPQISLQPVLQYFFPHVR